MPLPPHTRWVPGNSAGPYSSPVDKFLIHTTEGGTVDGAIAAYRKNNSWPHLTVQAFWGRTPDICGHLDLNVSARSLRNMAGGVQTNTDGVVQLEVVGAATRPGDIDWGTIARLVIGPICRTMGIPVQSAVTWLAYPASYGKSKVRLSGPEWTSYRGLLGHQHAPENDHGDPGAIPIDVILAAAGSTTAAPSQLPEDDDMPYLHFSQHTGWTFIDGAGATWLSDGRTVEELKAAGLKVIVTGASADDSRRIVSERGATIDDQVLAQLKTEGMYLAALQQTEQREEQRDLAGS